MRITEQAIKAFKEFISNMHGIAPNRLLLNEEDAERFKNEVLMECLYADEHPLLGDRIYYHGMRLVVDQHAVGVEVAYAR